MPEFITPRVTLPDGRVYAPPGWMYILAFALRGIPWAVEAALKPSFDAGVREWIREERNREYIESLEAEIAELRASLVLPTSPAAAEGGRDAT